jgi:hypothetical protein
MSEFVVKVPSMLQGEEKRLEEEVKDLVSMEEKRKMLSTFFDELMKGAGQLSPEETTRLGREVKKGRFAKLKSSGLV